MTHATTRPRGFRPILLGWAVALGLAVVPWHRLTVRLICAAVVLTLFGVWGAARA